MTAAERRGARQAPVRVLVGGDAATRAGVRLALEHAGIVVCAEAADAAQAVEAAVRERPDVCLLDVGLRGSGIAATARITARASSAAVVVLGSAGGDAELFDALRAGASGFLPRTTPSDRLAQALVAVAKGEAALPRRLVARLIEEFRDVGRRRVSIRGAPSVELTAREWEVLELLREGLSTAEIAERLFIAHVTVRRHVGTILKKLGVATRAEAVRLLEDRSDI